MTERKSAPNQAKRPSGAANANAKPATKPVANAKAASKPPKPTKTTKPTKPVVPQRPGPKLSQAKGLRVLEADVVAAVTKDGEVPIGPPEIAFVGRSIVG